MAISIQPTPLTALARERYISLTTFRKTGAAVATPVWFVQLEATLYVYSDATAGKVKRIHNNPQVRFAACTVRGTVTGPAFEGKARVLTDPREIGIVEAAISKKYGLTRRLLRLTNRLSGLVQRHRPKTSIAYLAITPIGS